MEEHNIVLGIIVIVSIRLGLDHTMLARTFTAGACAEVIIRNVKRSLLALLVLGRKRHDTVRSQKF